jgi:Tfp pilus assembly protein PilN
MNLLENFKKKKEKNINLIPKEQAESFISVRDLLIPLLIPGLAVILVILVFASLFTLEQTQKAKARGLEKEINQKTSQWQQFSERASAIKQIRSGLSTFQEGANQNKSFLNALIQVRNQVPNKVILTKLNVTENGEVSLGGGSKDPRAIFQLFVILRSQKTKFSNVALQNIGFQSEEEEEGGSQSDQDEFFLFTITLTVTENEEENN